MRELPPALRPWREPLRLFDDEVAAVVGGWLGPLTSLLGPHSAPRDSGGGEPDGYDGLARRGAYERLSLSEWLLAEEEPLEFMRRASMGEHVFTRFALRERAASTRVRALFDAGPWQLGAPRLAHLALLIALARRAETMGTRFEFAVLQQSPPWRELNADGIRALLEARTPHPVASDDLRAWREALGDGCAECWIVGAEQLDEAAAALPGRLVSISEVLDPGARQLDVRANPRHVRLDLPAERLCARTLRNPCRTDAERQSVGLLPASARFSRSGHRLFVRDGSDLLSLHVPNSAKDAQGRPKRLPAAKDRTAVAAFLLGRSAIWLVWNPALTRLELVDHAGGSAIFDAPDFCAGVGDVLQLVVTAHGWKAHMSRRVPNLKVAWVLDSANTLWRLEIDPEQAHKVWNIRGTATIQQRRVRAFCQVAHDDVGYAYSNEADAWLRVVTLKRGAEQRLGRYSDVHLDAADGMLLSATALAGASTWQLRLGPDLRRDMPAPPADSTVVGVVRPFAAEKISPPHFLLVHSAGHRVYRLDAAGGEKEVWNSAERIVRAAYHAGRSRLLCVLEHGGIAVLDVGEGEVVLRLEPNGERR